MSGWDIPHPLFLEGPTLVPLWASKLTGFKDRRGCLHSGESSNARLTTPAAREAVLRWRQFKEETVLACRRERTNHLAPPWCLTPTAWLCLRFGPYQKEERRTQISHGPGTLIYCVIVLIQNASNLASRKPNLIFSPNQIPFQTSQFLSAGAA